MGDKVRGMSGAWQPSGSTVIGPPPAVVAVVMVTGLLGYGSDWGWG